jgi:guanylate kinase
VSLKIEPSPQPERGALFVVSGPSGVGKTTLLHRALGHFPRLRFSVSATTRAPRQGETDGADYHFLSREQFDAKVVEGAFLEHATVYGNRYGTLAAPVSEAMHAGWSILLDIDVQGAAQVRNRLPEAVAIYVLPPSFEVLERRLRARSTDTEEVIQRRLHEAKDQLTGAAGYDYVVVNEDLDAATDQLEAILLAELHRTARHATLIARFSAPAIH